MKLKNKMITEVKQKADDESVLQIYIYGEVREFGNFNWETWSYENSETSAEYFKEILSKNKDVKEIEIYINSYGGSVFEGLSIYNQLKRHKAHKTVYIDGFACSISATIAMAGDIVIMPKNTLMMIHNMWVSTAGNVKELRKIADDLEIMDKAGRASYLEKAGDKLSEEELIAMMDTETWLTADDCIKYGLADKTTDDIVDLEISKEIMQKINLDTKQRLDIQKSLVAQLRNLVADNAIDTKIELEKSNKNKKENSSMMKFMAGIF